MKKLQTLNSILLASTLALAAATQALGQAVTLAEFDMGGTTTTAILSPSKQGATVTVTNLAANKVTFGNVNSPNPLRLAAAPTVGHGDAAPSAAAAITEDTYFSFTITPQAGQQITLSQITLRAGVGNDTTTRSFFIFSSVEGTAADKTLLTGSTTTGLKKWDTGGLTDYTHSFSGSQYKDITTPITFYIYVQAKDATQTLIFDDIRVTGTVTSAAPIPEPSTLALLAGLATLAAALVIRHTRS
ncbi:PEP-CTERM sorting domain-containing protein [Opitutaceae bacterium TAV4]|nr:PEP-CTERM sorting domain-containing protein [Opitutaceae bacterium TAV4]RRK01942.1 PEP-CTERM sorting domain-containing protein [Opitutaceae bacterium TAV3]RRK01951.1 PEP-CTERM sorting domain-containing protein [Opitutaceae bacterium TAV3]